MDYFREAEIKYEDCEKMIIILEKIRDGENTVDEALKSLRDYRNALCKAYCAREMEAWECR